MISSCAFIGAQQAAVYPADLRQETIATEISRLEASLAAPGLFDLQKNDLRIRLAMLYSHPNNAAPDFPRALQHLESDSRDRRKVDSRYVLMLLRNMQEMVETNDKLCRDLAEQKRQYQTLEKRCQALVQENQEKKEIIERLQYLDVELEKKRKQTGPR